MNDPSTRSEAPNPSVRAAQGTPAARASGHRPKGEVQAYLWRLGLCLAFGIIVMTSAAVAAWHFYGPKNREVVRRAPVMPHGAASTALPAYQR